MVARATARGQGNGGAAGRQGQANREPARRPAGIGKNGWLMTTHSAVLNGLSVLERGWLSSNNVLLHGSAGEGAVLVDSSHTLHSAQTEALLQQALA